MRKRYEQRYRYPKNKKKNSLHIGEMGLTVDFHYEANTCLTRRQVIHLVDQSVPHSEFKREKLNRRAAFQARNGSQHNLPQCISKEM